MTKLQSKGKHDQWFDRDHLHADLKNRSIKGGVSTVGAQVMAFSLTMISTIILARLLLPEDYGLIAMVTSITGFVLIFKDLGLAQAVIQKDQITQEEVSKVFWLNIFISVVLGAIIAALAPVLVYFYEEPKLYTITFAYSFVAVLGGLSVQHSALLRRQMHFRNLASITVSASALSILMGIVLGFMGAGYWALVAINVGNSFFSVILLWWKCSWRPDVTRVDKSIMDYVRFGADISGFNMINYFSRNLDNILIGKFIGSSALGLYNRAYQLLMIPITQLRDPLNAVGIPAMSSLDFKGERYRGYYKQYVFLLAFFSMPVVVFLAICAEPIILLVLGENWIEASLIFQLLAIVAFIQPAASTRGMVLISSGQSRRYLYWGLINAILVIIAFFIGINWNINGLIIAYAVVNYVILIPSLIFCFHNTSVRLGDFLTEASSPAIFSIIGGVITYLVYQQLHDWPSIAILAICFPVFVIGYLLPWVVMPVTRNRLLKVKELTQSILVSLKNRKKK